MRLASLRSANQEAVIRKWGNRPTCYPIRGCLTTRKSGAPRRRPSAARRSVACQGQDERPAADCMESCTACKLARLCERQGAGLDLNTATPCWLTIWISAEEHMSSMFIPPTLA